MSDFFNGNNLNNLTTACCVIDIDLPEEDRKELIKGKFVAKLLSTAHLKSLPKIDN